MSKPHIAYVVNSVGLHTEISHGSRQKVMEAVDKYCRLANAYGGTEQGVVVYMPSGRCRWFPIRNIFNEQTEAKIAAEIQRHAEQHGKAE